MTSQVPSDFSKILCGFNTKLVNHNELLSELLDLFEDENDKYFAYAVFEEKPVLTISKCDEDLLIYSQDDISDKFSLFLDTKNRLERFFFDSCEEFENLVNFCNYFGFSFVVK